MVNIGPNLPNIVPAKPASKKATRKAENSVGVSKHMRQQPVSTSGERRKGDRRRRNEKPLLDLRTGDDRRHNDGKSIDTSA